jgi:hypothetical protein
MDFKQRSKQVDFLDSEGVVIGSLTIRRFTLADDQTRAEYEEAAEQINKAEKESGELTDSQLKRQNFRMNIYPRLMACSDGDVPDEDTAFTMPGAELYKWFDAAKEVNPEWFRVFDELAEAYRKSKAEGEKAKKKKEAKQRG